MPCIRQTHFQTEFTISKTVLQLSFMYRYTSAPTHPSSFQLQVVNKHTDTCTWGLFQIQLPFALLSILVMRRHSLCCLGIMKGVFLQITVHQIILFLSVFLIYFLGKVFLVVFFSWCFFHFFFVLFVNFSLNSCLILPSFFHSICILLCFVGILLMVLDFILFSNYSPKTECF